MAYQFFHIDAVSKAGRDVYTRKNGKKKITGHISTDSVLGEADRLDGYISHIEYPLRPVILYGDKEKGIEVVQQKIEDWIEGTTDARGHKARKDANVLLAGVVSWPPINDGEDEREYYDRLKAFETSLLAWLQKEYGDDLVIVLRHDDEPFRGLNAGKIHYHWHYYCVKKPGKKFDLHPGFNARSKKDLSRKDKKTMTANEIKAAMKEGRVAYRKAMSDLQERFYQELGKDHGLSRYGPRRERRSRSEQLEFEAIRDTVIEDAKEKAEKNADEIIRKAEKKAVKLITEAQDTLQTAKNQAEKITKKAKSEVDHVIKTAWQKARDIINASEREAASILDNAKGFINLLLDKVSRLQGGESLVKWAKTYIISVNKPKAQSSNTHHNKQKNSR